MTADGGDRTRAMFESIGADCGSYPEGTARTRVSLDGALRVEVEADRLPHLRASLNSALRLVQASYGAIGPAKV